MEPLNEKELIKGKEYLIGRPKGDKVKAVYDPDDKKQFRRFVASGVTRHLHPNDRVYSVDGHPSKSRSPTRRRRNMRRSKNTRSRRNNNGNQHGI